MTIFNPPVDPLGTFAIDKLRKFDLLAEPDPYSGCNMDGGKFIVGDVVKVAHNGNGSIVDISVKDAESGRSLNKTITGLQTPFHLEMGDGTVWWRSERGLVLVSGPHIQANTNQGSSYILPMGWGTISE